MLSFSWGFKRVDGLDVVDKETFAGITRNVPIANGHIPHLRKLPSKNEVKEMILAKYEHFGLASIDRIVQAVENRPLH